MKHFFRILDRYISITLFIILLGMVIVVSANVFGRFILGVSISWGEEVAKMLLTYLTFFGAAYAMKDNAHYSFDFLIQKMPSKYLHFFKIFRWVVIIAISLLLLYWTSEVTIRIRNWIMPSTGLSKAFVYGVVPVSIILILVYSIRNLLMDIKNSSESA